jgi:hypothetical protein
VARFGLQTQNYRTGRARTREHACSHLISQSPCNLGPWTPESVGAGLGLGVDGAGGGGVTVVLPGPPFLQREKRQGRGDLISNSRRR